MARVNTIIVGTGDFARWHIRTMLDHPDATSVVGLVNRDGPSRTATRAVFAERGLPCPPYFNSIAELVGSQGVPDAALICTPHKFHFDNARDCLQRGVDVCIEKPMVMNAEEARELIALRDATQRLVVVAFPGSLSTAMARAKDLLREGAIGHVTAVAAHVHQNWRQKTAGTWRHDPALSGGGFLFDTGSHLINTVVDLIGDDVIEAMALLDHRGDTVDINASISGRFRNGVMFSLAAAGESIHCTSRVLVFGDRGVLQTGIWGERLLIQRLEAADFEPVPCAPYVAPWDQFLRVRRGDTANPCPAETGLRFALLMDMIRKSAATGRRVGL